MAATFHRVSGNPQCRKYEASATIPVNTLVQFTEDGKLGVAATNKSVAGIALEAGVNTQSILIDHIREGVDEVEVRGAGVTLSAALVGNHVDIATGNELSLTDTNKDALCVKFIDAATGVFVLKKCSYGGSVLE